MLLELALAAAAAGAAGGLRWLTPTGALAAFAVGAAILHYGGARWAAALLVFFLSGTLLTRVGREFKSQPEHRGQGRTAGQVLGTAGVAALISLLWGMGIVPDPIRSWLPVAFLGALAASAADTWATELGMLSKTPPRLITTWGRVPSGTSGGVTVVGCLAGVAGAVLVAGVGAGGNPQVFTAAWIAGVGAMLVDSLLGATVQASFRRPDGTSSEEPSRGAAVVRGVWWITNPVVNALATLAGALAAAALADRV